MTIGKDQIESAQDLVFEYVDVPEWGDKARMQEFGADDRAMFAEWMASLAPHRLDGETDEAYTLRAKEYLETDVRGVLGIDARAIALSLSNEDGSLVYPDWQEGIKALGKRNPQVLDRLGDVALRLSGFSHDAVEKTADELPNAPSSSAS